MRQRSPERPARARFGASPLEKPLTARQVAARVGVELKTVHNWAARGLLRHFRTPGRHLRFHGADVEEFLRRHGYGRAVRSSVQSVLGVVADRRKRALQRALGGLKVSWQLDPLKALIVAGRERPGAVLMESRALDPIDPARFALALHAELPESILVWVDSREPPDAPGAGVRHCRDAGTIRELFFGAGTS